MRTTRVLIFGKTSFTRSSVPDILADFDCLPGVDPSAIPASARKDFENNLEAYRLFVQEPDVPLREVTARTHVHPEQIYRLMQRVLAKAEDGRIEGLRGLIPNRHLKEYVRSVAVQASSKLAPSSAAGAMGQLLRRHNTLRQWLEGAVRNRNKKLQPGEIRAVRKPVRELHGEFLTRCRKCGVADDEYPFNQDMRGYRTFQRLVRDIGLKTAGGRPHGSDDMATTAVSDSTEREAWPIALRPFDMVQFDGHKIDIRLTLVLLDPFGMQTLVELHRIWILVVTDVMTKAILGYSLALGKEYNKDDFAEALQASIAPHRRVELTIPGLKVKEGGGFPTEVIPDLSYHRWTWLQFDEAMSHLSTASLERVTMVLGTWTIAGRLGEPNDRSYEERLFGLLERCGFHQVPGALGSSPTDEVRRLADVGDDLTRVIRLDELEQLAYVLVANRNGESQSGLGGRTALEAMRYLTGKPEYLIQSLPATKRHQLFLLNEAVLKTVRGRASVPHVNFEEVRYTSDILARRPELVGRKLRIYYVARDIRKLHAFFEDGSELGILTASRQWRTTPHSLRHRREILRLQRLGKIRWGSTDDPVEVYMNYKRGLARQNKRAANALAQAQANIRAAESDAARGHSPFPSAKPDNDVRPNRGSDPASTSASQTEARKSRSNKSVEPTPVRLKKTVIF
jgi:putative transposase